MELWVSDIQGQGLFWMNLTHFVISLGSYVFIIWKHWMDIPVTSKPKGNNSTQGLPWWQLELLTKE